MSHATNAPEVLTLDEVAAYLRLPKEAIVRRLLKAIFLAVKSKIHGAFSKQRLTTGCAATIVARCSCNKRVL